MERMPVWQVAIKRLDMPIQRFLFIFVGGAALTGLISGILVVFLTGGLGDGALFQGFAGVFMLLLLPIISALSALAYPLLEVQRSATKIERRCICSSLEWVFYRSEKSALSRFLIS